MFHATRLLKGTSRVFMLTGVVAALSLMATVTTSTVATAQKADKKAAAGAAAKKAPTPSWVKLCRTPKEGKSKVCLTRSESIEYEVLQLYGIAAIQTVEGKKEKSLIITLPYSLFMTRKVKDPKTNKEVTVPATVQFTWDIEKPIGAKVDEGKAIGLKLYYCHRVGCVAQANVPDSFIEEMKKGKNVSIIGQTYGPGGAKGTQVPINVSLKGFGAALSGPAVDNKKYQKYWNREIEKLYLQKLNNQNRMIRSQIEKQKKKKEGEKKK